MTVLCVLCCALFVSCSPNSDTSPGNRSIISPSGTNSSGSKNSSDNKTATSSGASNLDLNVIAASPDITLPHVPSGSDTKAEKTEYGAIDYSSSSDGYFMAKYTGAKTGSDLDIVLLVNTPNPQFPQYQYYLSQDGEYGVFPFSEGNGSYIISIFKRLQGNEFTQLMAVECFVSIRDELLPFLVTNTKVRYSGQSLSVKLASELTKDDESFFDRVGSVFSYVVSNISYDTGKAEAAARGELISYIPDNDQILRGRKGICFDYATVTTAMLRSLGIPTKVTFGYASTGATNETVYHAWISVYSVETGWVEGIIEFSSNGWTRMDPTFLSSSNTKSMANFIGNGDNYTDDLHF